MTHPVGEKLPNGFGVYDMHGNVPEWCWDWYGRKYYEQRNDGSDVLDPFGPPTGSSRVIRGGRWYNPKEFCRSAIRGDSPHRIMGVGFRLASALVAE